MAKQILETEHAKVFLDVVFGVIIALPMAVLPILVHSWAIAPAKDSLIPVLLLTSAIAFCAFYWLEVRRFIEEQRTFNDFIKNLPGQSWDLVNFTITRLVGSLAAIILVAAILKYAELNYFDAFLISSAIFWGLDFLGNVEGQMTYRKHRHSYDQVRNLLGQMNANSQCSFELRAYVGRFSTLSFWIDGIFSAICFLGLLALDNWYNQSVSYRLWASVGIMVLTLFRHLFWRTEIYDRWKGIR